MFLVNKVAYICLHKENEPTYKRKWIRGHISLATTITMSANEILFEDELLQPFKFEPAFTAAEIKAKKDSWFLTGSYITELDAQPAH